MIKCPLCTKTFRQKANFNTHMFSHTKEKPHKCHICSATFGLVASVKKHMKSVHDGIKRIKYRSYQCPLCDYKCYNGTELEIHLRKHTAERPFSCNMPSCGYKSKYKKVLSKHVRQVHCDERPYECPIDGCNYKAKLSCTLKNHLKVHSNERPFPCTVPGCKYTSKAKKDLKCHTSKVHREEKPFKCSMCEFRAKCSSNLRQHELTHIKIKRFHCQVPNCGYASHLRDKLQRHFDGKHRKKIVVCTQPGCKLRYGSIALLRAHLKRSHEKKMLKCPGDSCKYSVRSKDSLHAHVTRHHKDLQPPTVIRPRMSENQSAGVMDTMFRCSFPDCGFQTKFPQLYDRHIKTHKRQENRQHVCSFCFFRFSHTCELKRHLRRHVGEKPYSCSHCNYTNVGSHGLSNHAERCHNIRVIPRGRDEEEKKCGTCGRNCISHIEFVLHSMSHLQPVVLLERLSVHVVSEKSFEASV